MQAHTYIIYSLLPRASGTNVVGGVRGLGTPRGEFAELLLAHALGFGLRLPALPACAYTSRVHDNWNQITFSLDTI